MATQLTPSVESSGLNTYTIQDLLTQINYERRENNDDFLDTSSLLGFVNRASDLLNTRTDLRARLKSTTYAVNTDTTTFYPFSTLVSLGDMERIYQMRINSDTLRDLPMKQGIDYVIEPNPNGNGQGIRFIRTVADTLQILYYAYIPKITATSDPLPLSPNSNNYYVNKVLELVYRSEEKDNRAGIYEAKAEDGIEQLTFNNLYQDDGVVLSSGLFDF